ncbi:sensor histidine kinase [Nesterenkonia sp. F]|uniref:sensor histidine kinase n=1 Tax=Nesterenkonia sp. F TaxID=795955 RepID=UPI000255D1F6|nr:histidine kinase [Nesterenkonia sp. F]
MSVTAAARTPFHVRVSRFLEGRPWIADTVLLAGPLGLLSLGSATSGGFNPLLISGLEPAAWPLVLMFGLLTTLPLALRRLRPAVCAGLIAVGALLQVLTLAGPAFSSISVPIAVYSAAKFGSRRSARLYLIIALAGALLLGLYVLVGYLLTSPRGTGLVEIMLPVVLITGFAAAVVLACWLLGDLGGRRRREIAAIAQRNELLEVEREQEARLAADAERMRIAREMHDVVSHSMSVMIAQADGGRYVVGQDPQAAAGAFETIGRTGREALTEMRRMLGVLREQSEGVDYAPSPGLADLRRLVDDVRAVGLPVTLRSSWGTAEDPRLEDAPPLPEGAGLAVHRIVQEALTNTLKHGGGGAQADVALAVEGPEKGRADREPPPGDQLMVRISDTGVGSGADGDGRGSGLLGMDERARLYGGAVTTRAHPGGFDVVLRLPLTVSP